MKFIIQISGRQVALDSDQLNAVVEALRDAEFIDNHFVGKDKGDTGYDKQYVRRIQPFDVVEHLPLQAIPDDLLDTLRFATKLAKESA